MSAEKFIHREDAERLKADYREKITAAVLRFQDTMIAAVYATSDPAERKRVFYAEHAVLMAEVDRIEAESSAALDAVCSAIH